MGQPYPDKDKMPIRGLAWCGLPGIDSIAGRSSVIGLAR